MLLVDDGHSTLRGLGIVAAGSRQDYKFAYVLRLLEDLSEIWAYTCSVGTEGSRGAPRRRARRPDR